MDSILLNVMRFGGDFSCCNQISMSSCLLVGVVVSSLSSDGGERLVPKHRHDEGPQSFLSNCLNEK